MNLYRKDIDGLRAIAVISVILFHLGYLKNGYLGVDVFFVISGYLITRIVYKNSENNTFSLLEFYERRIRRIIPLVLFTTFVSLILGILLMLPDDLENLCQSVVATNFFSNNILMQITSVDYWDVKNDYKPLMHTWSLGVEEQFYLLFPIIFMILKGNRRKFILPLLIFLSVVSLILFLGSNNAASKFYFIQYRFYELALGGICAIIFAKNQVQKSASGLFAFLIALIFILFFKNNFGNDLNVILTTIFTAGILVLGKNQFQDQYWYKMIICNPLMMGVGKISFSLYMWHQIVFAFARYALFETITARYAILLSIVVIFLSISSYFIIESTFRNKNRIPSKPFFISIFIAFLITTGSSLYIYMKGGIIKDVPELGLSTSNSSKQLNFFDGENNINNQYNESIRALDRPFSETGKKIKILIFGNSFGRDVANILLESSFKNEVEIRYTDIFPKSENELKKRIQAADYIFLANKSIDEMIAKYHIQSRKVWIVGTKDFGNSNGIHYNQKIGDYATYRTNMKSGVWEKYMEEKKKYGAKYIDLIGAVSNSKGQVLVFTPDGKFISQDTRHLTPFGAAFFAQLLDSRWRAILHLQKGDVK